jgi:GTPase SAR1 family protein
VTTAYEHGKQALDDLISWYEQQGDVVRNEATTRLHLIDQLLTDVLGWPLEEIETEQPHGPEYADYALGKPAVRLILEAKREGVYFSVPVGTSGLVHRLPSLTEGKQGAALRDATKQVSEYCASRGVAMAAVSNGTQLVAFLGARTDGTPPSRGACLVFPSLSSMRENFRTMWDNVSRAGVENRTLHLTLREGELPTAPEPLSAQLPNYPGYRRRNDIQTDLQVLAELFLEDITREPSLQEEFLRETYAISGALSQYASVSKRILESRYSLLHETADVEVEPVNTKKRMASELNQRLREDIVASGVSRRPIILLGDVGVGKTMFIRRLIHVDAKEVFSQSVWLYIDFGSRPTFLSELNAFVTDEVEEQLLDRYGIDILERQFVEAVHNGALNRFDKGVHGELKELDPEGYRRERRTFLAGLVSNKESHLRASLNHIRGSMGKPIVIFLDNIDQRDFDFQERVFLQSESLANTWPATVFVSLRPDTFYRSRSEGALKAYAPRAFTIDPPQTSVVLTKRLEFALAQLRDTTRLASFDVGFTVSSDSLNAYLEVLRQNFVSNDDLVRLVDNLAAGNMRLALQFVSRFIGSGHVDTTKILSIYEEQGRYRIPQHEFLRAIIYGDSEYYDPEVSPVANLFDVSQPDGREHFLLPSIIAFVELTGDRDGTDGYVQVDEVYSFAQKAGFLLEQIAWAVDRGVKQGLLERAPRLAKARGNEHLRVTTAGVYTARVLAGMFVYLDAVVADTPILDSSYRSLITEVRGIQERLRRSEIFRVYLDRQWLTLERALEDPPFNWREHSDRARAEVARISQKAAT